MQSKKSLDVKANRNITVLHVVCVYFSLPFFLGNQLSYFRKKGYEIHISCSHAPQLESFARKHDCKFIEIEISRNISPLSDLSALFKLYCYIRKNKFDIVVGHTPKGGLIAMLAAWLARVKHRVYFRHGLVYETTRGLKRKLLENCERISSLFSHKIICVSPYLVERSISDSLGPKSKIDILNIGSCNGIDYEGTFNPDKISPDKQIALRKYLGITPNDFVVGYVGRLVKDKGVIELINAFEMLQTKNPNAKLLLVGPMEIRDSLPETIVEKIQNNPAIIHTGLIEENIEVYYSLMSVFVLCTHREGFGVSIIEAESMRIPVLTTSHTGARDAIIPSVTGEYIEMTSESIYTKLLMYSNNKSLCYKQGEKGREFVKENFSEKVIWNEIERKVLKF